MTSKRDAIERQRAKWRKDKRLARASDDGAYNEYMAAWRDKNRDALREYNREYQRKRRAAMRSKG